MKFVQLKSLKDLVMLVASSPATNIVQHLQNGDEHMYFVIGGTLSEIFLYFVKEKKAIDKNFITFNSYSGEMGFSEKIIHEPNINTFPVVEILNQDLLSKEMLEKVSKLKHES